MITAISDVDSQVLYYRIALLKLSSLRSQRSRHVGTCILQTRNRVRLGGHQDESSWCLREYQSKFLCHMSFCSILSSNTWFSYRACFNPAAIAAAKKQCIAWWSQTTHPASGSQSLSPRKRIQCAMTEFNDGCRVLPLPVSASSLSQLRFPASVLMSMARLSLNHC